MRIFFMKNRSLEVKTNFKKKVFRNTTYHQFPISLKSSYECGFRFEGKTYIFQTFFYGISCAVIMVNYMVNLAAQAASIKFGKMVEAYIDDIFIEDISDDVRIFFEDLGFLFGESKSKFGPVVDYCGIRVDGIKKTFQVTETAFVKMKNLWEKAVFRKSEKEDMSKFMLFSDFQQFMGYVVRMSKTSISGLLKSHFLLAKLAEAIESDYVMVELERKHQEEIAFWLKERHEILMEQFLPAAGSLKILDENPAKKPKLVKGVLENSTDSSSRYWGIKFVRNGVIKAKAGPIPEELLDKGIACQEGYAFDKFIDIAEPKTRSKVGLDSQVLQICFSKRRTKNEVLNKILLGIFKKMEEKELFIDTYWIPTKTMFLYGADKISRRNFSEFEELDNGLSEFGANYVIDTYGHPKMDIFGSASNVFKSMYCSDITILDDKFNMKMSGLEFLCEKRLSGLLWVYPRPELVKQMTDIVGKLMWKNFVGVKMLILVMESKVQGILANLGRIEGMKKLKFETFARMGRKPSKLSKKTKQNYVLVVLESIN